MTRVWVYLYGVAVLLGALLLAPALVARLTRWCVDGLLCIVLLLLYFLLEAFL